MRPTECMAGDVQVRRKGRERERSAAADAPTDAD
jgi:hypothetical protein